jgi:outer membrane receptor protein involved in Fe transport
MPSMQMLSLPGNARIRSIAVAAAVFLGPGFAAAQDERGNDPIDPLPPEQPREIDTGQPAQGASVPAADTAQPPSPTDTASASETQPSSEIVVKGRLDEARDQIAPSLGAVTYSIGQDQIAATPQGEDASFNQVLLRAPGVVLDSFGEEHVRGEHGGLTYRVNGVLLPEGLNGFGQELDTRIIHSVTLITGSLPAQFGFRTAGIVDVSAKSGEDLRGAQVALYGGSFDWVQPSVQLGGSSTRGDYFLTGSYLHNAIGIENPTSSVNAIHDNTDQGKLFGYGSLRLDDESRISVLASGNYATFQLPDTPGLAPADALAGASPVLSRDVNERQDETNAYLVVSYQQERGALNLQVSSYLRYGRISYYADNVRDLIFQGVAADVDESFTTVGVQGDASYKLGDAHTLRAGLIGEHTNESLITATSVFPVASDGMQASTFPLVIDEQGGNNAWQAGIYLQDEWRPTETFTINYGLRYDRFEANFDQEGQLSPRVNLVWTSSTSTTAHLGYARYFAPASAQYLSPSELDRFAGTTNAPSTFVDTPTRVERSHYFDAGFQQKLLPGWQVTLDGFYKDARNLGDLGQFGAAVILSPFSYRHGEVYGGEFSSTYARGPWSLFSNFSYVNTSATDINSAEYEFPVAELAYISTHSIKLDHEGEYTVSAGASYASHDSRIYADMLYGYGLRAGFANLKKEPSYVVFNLGGEHSFLEGVPGKRLTVRLEVTNLFDRVYQIRNGSGLGIFAAQYGRRRGIFLGLTCSF